MYSKSEYKILNIKDSINLYDPFMTEAVMTEPFHDGGRYHIETSPLICAANQWTGFYVITAYVMKMFENNQIIR